jgi:hypothetical protein
MSKKNNAVFLVILFCIIFSLLVALAPLSDFDHDGSLDSLITEGFLLGPVFYFLLGLSFLLIEFSVVKLAIPWCLSIPFLPPPIPVSD